MTDDIFAAGLPTLTTSRGVHVRAVRASDVDAVFAVFGDAETLRYWSHEPFADRAEAVAYVDAIDRAVVERVRFQWAIAADDDDELLGTVTLNSWDRRHRRAEIGFILRRDRQGRGIARACVGAVVRFGFDVMDLHRIEADVDPENAASLKLLKKLGFVDEGLQRERWFTFGAWRHAQLLGLLKRNADTSAW